jgi:signal peptidase I
MTDSADVSSTDKREISTVRWLLETAILIALAFALAQGIKGYLVQAFVIPSGSMIPTIQEGERVFAEKISYRFLHQPEAGDIVVFNNPEYDPSQPGLNPPILIKRVIALEGQTVDLEDGRVVIDGIVLAESYTHDKPTEPLNPAIQYPFTLEKGTMWVMGDNRTNSGDSRAMGPVAVDASIGRAVWKYWPPKAFGPLQ